MPHEVSGGRRNNPLMKEVFGKPTPSGFCPTPSYIKKGAIKKVVAKRSSSPQATLFSVVHFTKTVFFPLPPGQGNKYS